MADRSQIAPGRLELVRAFVNTADIEDGLERIGTAPELTAWLRENAELERGTRASATDVERAIELREALRSMLAVNGGAAVDPDAVALLDRAADDAKLRLEFHPDCSSTVEPEAAGVPAALGRLLGIVHESMADGTWDRLKVCDADDCWWAFYDHSKNHSRRWCTMSECGNRAKVRSYRARQSA